MKKMLQFVFSCLTLQGIFAQPTITSFAPTTGPVGTTVTITGTNFGANPADNIVYFGAVKAIVSAANNSSLSVIVPPGATYQPITITINGLTAYSAQPFIVTFKGGNQAFTENSFAPKIELASLGYYRGIVTGDLDGDGKADMVTSSELGGISIFRNTGDTGNISFAERIDIYIPDENNYYDLAIGDLDGDGKLDIAILNGYSVDLFRNTSTQESISFEPKVRLAGGGFGKIAIGDLDGDGKPDIASVNNGNYPDWNHIIVLKNKSEIGQFIFDHGIDIPTTDYPFGVAIGDLDGDGKPELTVSNNGFFQTSGTSISVFKNISSNGKILFETSVQYTTGKHPEDIAISDLDGDGKPDVAVCNSYSNSVSIFKNVSQTGVISLACKVDYYSPSCAQISIGDLNGDGKPDLATVGGLEVTVYRNTCTLSNISFDKGIEYTTGYGSYGGVAISDLDGDSKPDLAIAHYYGTPVVVLRNLIKSSKAPSISYVTDINSSQAYVHWDPFLNATSYIIRRYPAKAASTEDTGVYLPVTDTFRKVQNMLPGTQYFVQVKAYLSNGDSTDWSAPVGFYTTTNCVSPASLYVSNIADTCTKLHWNLPANGVSSVSIRYRILGSLSWSKERKAYTEKSIRLCGLTPNTTYEWQVRNICDADKSNWVTGPNFTTASSFAVASSDADNIGTAFIGKNNLQITPNPNKGNFTLQMQLPAKAAATKVSLYNNVGQLVWQQQLGNICGAVQQNFALAGKLPGGLYTLTIQRNDIKLNQKILIDK